MKPTPKLRLVERDDETSWDFRKKIQVLQQWWGIEEDHSIGEWRDVPLEKEE
jgi:hypothetical protein